MSLINNGVLLSAAAAKAGMSERTARKYERVGKLPSELKRAHTSHAPQSVRRGVARGRGADRARSGAAGQDIIRGARTAVSGAI